MSAAAFTLIPTPSAVYDSIIILSACNLNIFPAFIVIFPSASIIRGEFGQVQLILEPAFLFSSPPVLAPFDLLPCN